MRDGLDLDLSEAQLEGMRDGLSYRGPDGHGYERVDGIVFGHSRLAVRDLGPGGQQPMRSADGRWTLVYNGELYEDEELRAELSEQGREFHTRCDGETVLAAFEHWGLDAITRLRGMFALAVFDRRDQRLTLARDPLGMKPLYWWCDGRELAFASSTTALLAHPRLTPEPDLAMVSAYLTTIRTTLGAKTLFNGVNAIEPGEVLSLELNKAALVPRSTFPWPTTPVGPTVSRGEAAARLRLALEDSTRRHLAADVTSCSLLSGGLDSSVIAAIAVGHTKELHSWCAGSGDGADDDFAHARQVAQHLGTEHHEVHIDGEEFDRRWGAMVDRLGVPLSTPNEVAINAVAEGLRANGAVVALSGEGADELLAGYEGSMLAADAFERAGPEFLSAGRFQLESAAWISPAAKPEVLRPELVEALEDDAFLISEYERIFARCAAEVGPAAHPLDPHLRFLRRLNLTGLLGRLDTATMLAGVEGRTPFADTHVLELADSLPFATKFDLEGARVAAAEGKSTVHGKLALRRAFAQDLPASVISRPKASFPLPFQGWLAKDAARMTRAPLLQAFCQPQMLERVAADPAGNWPFAWPLANLARWGDRWWG